ncbi:AcvB/VirJ family lysyl-phosphatidylglycerol hydrolase [Stenotrophomonas sp. HITSZ_GD]|uniref:virulence factor family protein n=1 Tax=Stenotrophomonas sp. HITSZ_GD TaxID=3037248 RepID=UPI00240DEB75|nr:AcvB/VirJ family lysyl-phosphatidylglycerol hydrolase [Stenotrophomonas sp. HITSZ_GD]MDG2526221.1 AcvB/VirJ family lysyl-phosphatidylglycerol hydrolase [Stenotrophomonas sp. HITSZ_GD]
MAGLAAALLVGSGIAIARHGHGAIGGRYGQPDILRPAGAPRALVEVFPDPAQPARARAAARQLAADGALVAVIDTGRYLGHLREGTLDCATLADDAERLGKRLLRKDHSDVFLPPLLVGDGAGADLVRQALAGAAPDVLAGAVAVGGASDSGLTCGRQAPVAGQGAWAQVPASVDAAGLATAVKTRFAPAGDPGVAGLPLVEMPVPGSHRLAIVISGDGGWRELDKGISAELNRQGVSVVGWNSLRYFWKEKSPQQVADDLARVMATYGARWHADDIALVGYSFGADVMPFAYDRLPPAQRAQVRFVSLLGLAHGADFQVRVGGWLGWGQSKQVPILPALLRMDTARVQCIHGEQEKDTLCPSLAPHGVAVVARPGGHHFDHDPVKLAGIVLAGWAHAPAAPAAAVAARR